MRRIASSLNKLRDDRSLLRFCCGVTGTIVEIPRARQPRRQRRASCRVLRRSSPRARKKSRAARRNRRTRTQRAKTASTNRRVWRASRSCVETKNFGRPRHRRVAPSTKASKKMKDAGYNT